MGAASVCLVKRGAHHQSCMTVCSTVVCAYIVMHSSHPAPSRLPSSPATKGPYATGGTLHLVSSRPGDSGEYCCVAENKLGSAVECTTVNIVEESE